MRDEKLKLMFMYKLARRLEKETMWYDKFGESYDVYKRRKLDAEKAARRRKTMLAHSKNNPLGQYLEDESIGSRRHSVEGRIFKYDIDKDGNCYKTTSTIDNKKGEADKIDFEGEQERLRFATIARRLQKEEEEERRRREIEAEELRREEMMNELLRQK